MVASVYTRCINSKVTKHQDYDRSAIDNYLLTGSCVLFTDFNTLPEFDLNTGVLSGGVCAIRCTRTSGANPPANKEFMAIVHVVGDETVNVTGTRKIFIEIPENLVNDGTLINNEVTGINDQRLGLGIAVIKSELTYPAHTNYIPLREINAGVPTDVRPLLQLKGGIFSTVPAGNITGGNRKLFATNGSGVLVEIPFGSVSQVLTSNGMTALPDWQSPSVDINATDETDTVKTEDYFLIFRPSDLQNYKIASSDIFESTDFPLAEDVQENDVLYEDMQEKLDVNSTEITDNMTAGSFTNSTSRTAFAGIKCFAKEDLYIKRVTVGGAITTGRIRITYNGVNYDTACTTGTATFANPVYIPKGGVFFCQFDNNGASFNIQTKTVTYPVQGTLISFFQGLDNGANHATNHNHITGIVATRAGGAGQGFSFGRNSDTVKITFDAYGSGIQGNTVILPISKIGTPGNGALLRIETDNAGAPSGTLFHANATGNVVAGSINASMGLITFNLGGNITIPKGQKVWFVLSQVTNAIDANNYYTLGGVKKITKRNFLAYDGSVWAISKQTNGSAVADPHAIGLTNQTTGTPSSGALLFAKKNIVLNTVSTTSHGGGTVPNRMHLADENGTIFYTQAITIGVNATVVHTLSTPQYIKAGTYFQVLFDRNGASYAGRGFVIGSIVSKTNIDYINGIYNNAPAGWMNWLENINTTELEYGRPSIDASIVYNTFVSKASAKQLDTLPLNRVLFANDDASEGEFVNIKTSGKVKIDGIVDSSFYYLSDVAGTLSLVNGTNRFVLGKSISDKVLNINPMLADGVNVAIPDISVGVPCFINDTNVQARVAITGGTVTVIEIMTIGGVYFQIATTTNQYLTLNPGEGVRITSSAQATLRVFYII